MVPEGPADLLAAVVKLHLQPRGHRWSSLSFAIVDAVWSIGARYNTVVVPVLKRVAEHSAAAELMSSDTRLPDLNAELRKIPGEDGQGICRGYLWMLLGDDHLIKPDRMVLRWLAAHGGDANPASAWTLIADLAVAATGEAGRDVAPWEIDPAMWLAARRR